ncbi:hypothetical protein U5640_26170 [Streptomyces sp. SS7]
MDGESVAVLPAVPHAAFVPATVGTGRRLVLRSARSVVAAAIRRAAIRR